MGLYGVGDYGTGDYGSEATLTALTQSSYPPRVALTADGMAWNSLLSIQRTANGVTSDVRMASGVYSPDETVAVIDWEQPFGVPVTYSLVFYGVTADTAGPTTYTLTGGKVAVTDPVSGLSAETVILAWPDRKHGRRAAKFQVGARNITVVGELAGFEGDIEFYTPDTDAGDALFEVLRDATSGTVQIRQPGGYDGVDSYVSVLDVDNVRITRKGSDEARVWKVSAVEVAGWPLDLPVQAATLQDIADFYAAGTLATINADYDSLLLLSIGYFGG